MKLKVIQIYNSTNLKDNSPKQLKGLADILVYLDNDEQYISSFLTYAGIKEIAIKHQKNGAFLHGSYFWAKHLILVKDSNLETIEKVVQDLLEEGDFRAVFKKI